jgi:3-oxoacid CoA-transferase B subunit
VRSAARTTGCGATSRIGAALRIASADLGVDLAAHLAGMRGDRAFAEARTPGGRLGIVRVGPGRRLGIGSRGAGEHCSAIPGTPRLVDAGATATAAPPLHDIVVIGGSQVSASGDLAIPTDEGRRAPDLRGVTDLLRAAGRVTVVTEHVTVAGRPRIKRACETPPVARRIVHRIVTDLAVFDVYPHGLLLVETVGATAVGAIREATDAPFAVAPGIAPGRPPE